MQNIIIKENKEINELAMEYRNTGAETVFNELYEAVNPLAEQVAYKAFHKYGKVAPKEDFVNEARMVIFTAVNKYDSEKGGHFTAFLKQNIEWKMIDEFVKKTNTQKEQFNKDTLYFDQPLASGEGTFLDAVEHKASANLETYEPVGNDTDAVFNEVAEQETESTENNLMDLLKDLTVDFAETIKEQEALIAKTVVATIITGKATNKKAINEVLVETMPDVAPATVRKKKSRVMVKFNDFAKEQGFEQFDLSQF